MKRSEYDQATYAGAMLIAAHMAAAHMTALEHSIEYVTDKQVERIARRATDIAYEIMANCDGLVDEEDIVPPGEEELAQGFTIDPLSGQLRRLTDTESEAGRGD